MSDFLALDWEQREVCGLDAQVTRGRVGVRQSFRLQWPADLDRNEQPEQAGRWLAEQLSERGISGREVIISLPREDVVVRQLQVPDVPDEELPDVVHLQAETKTSSSLDRLALDFLPLPRLSSEGRHVLMVTLGRDRLGSLQKLVEAAGLQLVSVGVSPVATAEIVARAEQQRGDDPDEASLVVTRIGRRVEISVIRSRHLLFTHSTQVSGTDEEQDGRLVLAEIRRSQGALMRLDSDIAVRRAWVVGSDGETGPLCSTFREQLAYEVRGLDPVSESDVQFAEESLSGAHGPYAGPVGLLLTQTGGLMQSLDLLNPRKKVVRPDRRRLKVAASAAAVLLVVSGVFGAVKWKASSLDDRIEKKRDRITWLEESRTKTLEEEGPVLEHARLVGEWSGRNVDLLEQMGELKTAIGSTERLYLADFRHLTPAGRTAGRIVAFGYARSRDDVEQLNQDLSERGYVVDPKEIVRDSPDSGYPYRFDLEVEIPLPPQEAASTSGQQPGRRR